MSSIIVTARDNNSRQLSDFLDKNNDSIFQSYEMYEVFSRTKNYNPFFLKAYSSSSGEIFGTLLGVSKTVKSGILSSLSTHTSVRGGPVFSKNSKGFTALIGLLKYQEKVFSKKSIYDRIYNNYSIKSYNSIFGKEGFVYEDYLNYIINLTNSKEKILRNISKSKRKKINKCIKEGIEVIEITDLLQINDFYNCLEKNFDRSKWTFPNISLFYNVFEYLVPKKMAIFHLAKYNNSVIGGRVSLLYKEKIYAWFIGMDYQYKNLGVNTFLNWNVIEWGIENGFKEFDFGGAGRPNEDFGMRKYKSEFGGNLVNYGRFNRVNNNFLASLSQIGFQVYRRII